MSSGKRAPSLEVMNLAKSYDGVAAVRDVSFSVARGEFLTLLGPSGSGKTTTLLLIAGLLRPNSGDVYIDGRRVTDAPTHLRNLSMVFQNFALFPHLTVRRNVSFALEMRRAATADVRARVEGVLQLAGLTGLADRYPHQLSGGQQQRVALARAIVHEPPIMLMDEPLNALDRNLRDHLQLEVMRVHTEKKIAIVYVTHDRDEAFTMATRIAVFREGLICQIGTPREIYDKPVNKFVAGMTGGINAFNARVTALNDGCAILQLADEFLRVPMMRRVNVGDTVILGVRPERLRLNDEAASIGVDGLIVSLGEVAGLSHVYVELQDGQRCMVTQIRGGDSRALPNIGSAVRVSWQEADLLQFSE